MAVIDEVVKDYIVGLAASGKRKDERSAMQFRPFTVEKNPIPNAEGSALVKLGKTSIMIGVKVDPCVPFPDRPDEGVLSTNAELVLFASPTYEAGPPNENSIELARVVDRAIRSANAIDVKSLLIEPGKAWGVYIDLYVLDADGNLFDAACLGATAALQGCRIPKWEDGKVIRTEAARTLELALKPITCTFIKIGGKIFLDPNEDEEKAAEGTLTIATTEDRICAMQKSGKAGFTEAEIGELMDIALDKSRELRKAI